MRRTLDDDRCVSVRLGVPYPNVALELRYQRHQRKLRVNHHPSQHNIHKLAWALHVLQCKSTMKQQHLYYTTTSSRTKSTETQRILHKKMPHSPHLCENA